MSNILTETATRLFADHCDDRTVLAAETGAWPEKLWAAVDAAGFTTALIQTGEHVLGVSISDAFAIARIAGRYAAPIPLAETMLANWLLTEAGLDPATGPLVVVADAGLRLNGSRLSGSSRAVPWGRRAGLLVVVDDGRGARLINLGRRGVSVEQGANIAREPRDHLTIDCDIDGLPTATLPSAMNVQTLRAAGAALRCAQMAGAMERAAQLTLRYASEREQFGKPIAKFQAIQHSLAVLAEHAAASCAAADMAADAFADGIDVARIAAAKSFISEAVGPATSIAHQVHGAMGFSQEYALHFATRRLWSWRDEYGNDAEWAALLGRRLAAIGADALWSEITAL